MKRRFWSLGLYGVKRITPKEARNVDIYLLKRKQKFTFQMKTEKQYATFAKSKTPKHHSLVISNFHPILLTCISIPSKLLEHITFSNVVGCLEGHNILSKKRHRLENNSYPLQLIIACVLDRRAQTNAIFIDFSGAFDNVSINKFSYKYITYLSGRCASSLQTERSRILPRGLSAHERLTAFV